MARILESTNNGRRIIKLSTDDIISIVQEYQQYTKGYRNIDEIRNILEDKALFVPESI